MDAFLTKVRHPDDKSQNESETSRPTSELSCENERGLTTDTLGGPVQPEPIEQASLELEPGTTVPATTDQTNRPNPRNDHDKTAAQQGNLDIGVLCGEITDQRGHRILTGKWIIPKVYTFPTRNISGKNRKFNASWLNEQPWLRYSASKDGVYCCYSCLFGTGGGEAGHFGSQPVSDWKNISHMIKRHLKCKAYLTNTVKVEGFLSVSLGKQKDVRSQLSSAFSKQIERNRKIISSILDVTIVCGKQNIPLRGRTEDTCNFMALIKFHAKVDPVLEQHLASAPNNAKYLSPQIQNELIELCREQIRDTIVKDFNDSLCFSLMADEATDCATLSCNVYKGKPTIS